MGVLFVFLECEGIETIMVAKHTNVKLILVPNCVSQPSHDMVGKGNKNDKKVK